MAVYGFNQNDNNRNFNPFEVMSIILTILVIVLGAIFYKVGVHHYNLIVPFIEAKCISLGLLGVLIIKFLFAFLLLMMLGISHITIVVNLMEFIRKLFK